MQLGEVVSCLLAIELLCWVPRYTFELSHATRPKLMHHRKGSPRDRGRRPSAKRTNREYFAQWRQWRGRSRMGGPGMAAVAQVTLGLLGRSSTGNISFHILHPLTAILKK